MTYPTIPRRWLATITAALLLLGAAVLTAAAAHATQHPDRVTVTWLMPPGGTQGHVTWPQTLYSESGALPAPSCRRGYIAQVDLYDTSTPHKWRTYQRIISDGQLTLVGGHPEDHTILLSAHVVDIPRKSHDQCHPKPTPTTSSPTSSQTSTPPTSTTTTPSPTTTSHTTPPVTTTTSSHSTPPASGTTTHHTRHAAVASTTTPQAAAASGGELAYTGAHTAPLLIVAVLLLAAGILLLGIAWRREHPRHR